jgi:pimeloyl-ACP methyl ester carboxylesterase
MYFPYRGETKELDEFTRRDAGGSYVQLSDGVTHIELSDPSPFKMGEEPGSSQENPPVVLIHGFSVPYFIFDPTFEALPRAGLHVLRYDLFSRGWSDRPNLKYDIHLFVKQLVNLLDALDFKKVSLVSLSMGGPIAASFTVDFPERIHKLVLIDPSGARLVNLSAILKAVKMPAVGELAFSIAGNGNLAKSVATDFFDPKMVAEFQSKYLVQMQFKGFKRAILSTLRSEMLGSFIEKYRKAGKLNKPTLLIWGRNDATIPLDHSEDIREAIPHAEFHIIQDCGHIPHYEKSETVNPILLQFLR